MPVKLAKRGGQFCAVDEGGKVDKCFPDRSKAVAYIQAKNIGIMRQKGDRRAPPKPKRK